MTSRRAGPARRVDRLALLARIVLLTVAGLLAAPSSAGADAAGPTDYRTEVVSISPEVEGISARAVGGDAFFELTVAPSVGVDVVVVGYRGEPYLRFRTDGAVEENRRAPTTYLNADRYTTSEPPAEADATAPPEWVVVGHGGRWAWHDHRTHWMNAAHPPGREAGDVILEAVVPLRVGDADVDVSVVSTWLPAPSPVPAVVGAVAAAALAGAALRAGRTRRTTVGLCVATVALAALAVGVWQTRSVPPETGPPLTGWALPATAVVLAGAALARRWSPFAAAGIALAAAVQLVVWGARRRDGLVRAILPTDAPFWFDRSVTAAALAAGLVLAAGALWRIGRMLAPARPASA